MSAHGVCAYVQYHQRRNRGGKWSKIGYELWRGCSEHSQQGGVCLGGCEEVVNVSWVLCCGGEGQELMRGCKSGPCVRVPRTSNLSNTEGLDVHALLDCLWVHAGSLPGKCSQLFSAAVHPNFWGSGILGGSARIYCAVL